MVVLEVFEDGVPLRFRLHSEADPALQAMTTTIETVRPDGARQGFALVDRGDYLESTDEIPEPHAFTARVRIGHEDHSVVFADHEHAHGASHRDNNIRAAVVHVIADAAVSVLVIVDLFLARTFGWLWMDPLAGIIGTCVIGSWSYGLIRHTGAILLDMNPDRCLSKTFVKRSKPRVTPSTISTFGGSAPAIWARSCLSRHRSRTALTFTVASWRASGRCHISRSRLKTR
jgi:hypothetical protein